MAAEKPVVVIKKKKGGHGGHHGGAWKIAYADFVTAMMCFFLCMWLINSASVVTRENIASYFRKPSLFNEGSGMPLLLGGAGILSDAYVPPKPIDKRPNQELTQDPAQRMYGESNIDRDKHYVLEGRLDPKPHRGPDQVTGLNSDKQKVEEIRRQVKLTQIAEISDKAQTQVKKLLEQNPAINQSLGKLDLKVEEDGLKIEIMDTDRYSMFDSGSARIRKEAESAFQSVTDVIKQFPSTLDIVGHTDAKPFPSRSGGYTNWELSADRANSARRLIESQGYPGQNVASVIGRASSEPKTAEDPLSPGNRRITLKVKFDPDRKDGTDSSNKGANELRQLLGLPPAQTPQSAPTGEASGAPTPTPTATPTPTPTATPTPLPTASSTGHSGRIVLPEGTPITQNPDYMPKDKIFGNNPVLGAKELYSGS
jgi:chemotaxis protein MotB